MLDFIVNVCYDMINDGIDRLEARYLFGYLKKQNGDFFTFAEEA